MIWILRVGLIEISISIKAAISPDAVFVDFAVEYDGNRIISCELPIQNYTRSVETVSLA